MAMQLRLNVDQVSAAIMLLNQTEKKELKQRMPLLLGVDQAELEDIGWLRLAESAFEFWDDPAEDIYDDLVLAANLSAGQ